MAAVQTAWVPLESGDRLTRAEFHRRYKARPDIKKAELVEGVVYVASPVSTLHSGPHGMVAAWLGVYQSKHPQLRLDLEPTVFLDEQNEVQPDACLWREDPDGPRRDEKGYIVGAPQLVVEIAASSAAYDLHAKKEVYRRAGVLEYVVWQVYEGMIDWFRLRDGEYVDLEPNEDAIVQSEIFPGLRLAIDRMASGDLAGVLEVLNW